VTGAVARISDDDAGVLTIRKSQTPNAS